MSFTLFIVNSLLLALAMLNFATIRRPSKSGEIDATVTILLPVRNEAENIERILRELEGQINVPRLSILVIDDSSDDQTFQLAQGHASARVSIVQAPLLSAGWIGKVGALQAGYRHIEADLPEVVISIDADVHFEPDAISRAVSTLQRTKLDFISPYPRQIAESWSERLVQPLLQWSWMSTVLLRGAEKFPLSSTVICNGQFLLMRGSSLKTIGGFESVSHKVLDDIELGRSFVAAGFKGTVISGSDISSTRMYQGFNEIRAGYGKSLHLAFGSIAGSVIAALFVGATALLPLIYALNGDLLAIAALLAIIGTRIISAGASGTRLRDAFLHPISASLFIYLLYFSWSNRGKTQWKGRTL
jgi:cellulose synthase/poly-beta-1,6-N-acetylglucosamine synthase-like glycosyltransferase